MALLDTSLFGILSAARKHGLTAEPVKEAFTPSPAIAQAVMQQAQGGGGGGGDPSQGGGAPPGGMPPGGDPAAMDAAMQGQPGPGGGAPPAPSGPQGDPSPGGSSDPALAAKLDQLTQLIQQQAQQGGAGANGKPNMASVKFEPQHFHQLQHDISNIKAVMMQLADAAGLQVPASTLIQQPAPGATAPTDQSQAGAQGGQGAQPGAAGAQQPPPSNVAQQLPSLPPVAQKTASAEDLRRLANGVRVAAGGKPRQSTSALTIAKLAASRLARK